MAVSSTTIRPSQRWSILFEMTADRGGKTSRLLSQRIFSLDVIYAPDVVKVSLTGRRRVSCGSPGTESKVGRGSNHHASQGYVVIDRHARVSRSEQHWTRLAE